MADTAVADMDRIVDSKHAGTPHSAANTDDISKIDSLNLVRQASAAVWCGTDMSAWSMSIAQEAAGAHTVGEMGLVEKHTA